MVESNVKLSKLLLNNLTNYEKEQAKNDIKMILLDNNLNNWKDCAILSTDKFVEVYVNNILILIYFNNF